jgi:hypothetical protein
MILFRDKNYLDFIPNNKMTHVEQLNAVTRFCIYLIIILILTKRSKILIYTAICVIILTIIFYLVIMKNENNKIKLNELNTKKDKSDEIQYGFYDFDNKLNFPTKKQKKKYYNKEQMKEYNKTICSNPTIDNPFMNGSIETYKKYDPPEPCNVDDDEIKSTMVDLFNVDLYRDVGDLFENKNSQRMFYTVPYTNAPNQSGFANWLYGNYKTCKTDQKECLQYEDLRYSNFNALR